MEDKLELLEPTYLIKPDSRNSSLYPSASERRTMGGEQASASGREAEGLQGLTYSHNSPPKNKRKRNNPKRQRNDHNATIEYYLGGSLVKVRQPLGKQPEGQRDWKRGKCMMMSPKSRRGIMNLVSTLIRTIIPLFVTLTYPDNYPSARDSKKHLDNFIKRLKRKYPNCGYIWKLELQKRGAPHFHIFLWGLSGKRSSWYDWMSTAWYEVVKSGDPLHEIWGVKVEEIRSYNGVRSYVSKYIAKKDETEVPEGLGRSWGYGGKIPISDKEEYLISPQQAAKVLRYLRRRIRQKKNKGIRAFYVDNPERWRDNHPELTGDKVPF
jgi:hypothetical protein